MAATTSALDESVQRELNASASSLVAGCRSDKMPETRDPTPKGGRKRQTRGYESEIDRRELLRVFVVPPRADTSLPFVTENYCGSACLCHQERLL